MDLIYKFTVTALVIMVAACATPPPPLDFSSLRPGMTRQEVIAKLGEPSRLDFSYDTETLYYDMPVADSGKALRCMGAGFSGQAYLHPECSVQQYDTHVVRLQNDLVVSYGSPIPAQAVPTVIVAPAPYSTTPGQSNVSMCPDGSYVSGNCQMAPNGSYVGSP